MQLIVHSTRTREEIRKGEYQMSVSKNDMFQYESFEAAVLDLKSRYRRTHRDEIDGLHYEFHIRKSGERSGFVKAQRLEAKDATTPQDESILIEDNRVVYHEVAESKPSYWIEVD